MNADGVADILSGCYSAPDSPKGTMAGFLYVLEGKGGNSFGEVSPLKTTEDEPIVLPGADGMKNITKAICTHPFAYDWDQDGDLDLVVGNFAGDFCLIKNEGDAQNAQFETEGTYLQAGEKDLNVPGHHGAPFVIDWDGDGDQDILSGSGSGGVYWAENKGTHAEPEFEDFTEVIAPPPGDKAHQQFLKADDDPIPASGTRLWVIDYNHDGKLDLLVGDNVTIQRAKEGQTEEEVAKRKEEFDEEMKRIGKEFMELRKKLQDLADAEGDDEQKEEDAEEDESNNADEKKELEKSTSDLQAKAMKLSEAQEEYLGKQRTGFVWLYLQK